MEEKNLIVTEQEQGKRLDVYLTSALDISRSYAQQLIQRQGVTVNGKDAKANRRLNEGDQVKAVIEVQEEYKVVPQDIPLDIVYEDKDIIVINKARGMVVHPAAGNPDGTLVNALLYHCQGELSGINGVIRPGIVHRLDKDTSGVMVAAKNDAAHLDLAEQIRTKAAHRIYWAIVCGNIREEAGVIKGDIGRHPTDRKKMAIVHEHGKPAVTHFRVLERFGDYTLVECRLETGRTHQIRVHMAHIGHPLLGDLVYGHKRPEKGLSGQCLHARALRFIHPRTGKLVTFTCPLPDYFQDVLARLGPPVG